MGHSIGRGLAAAIASLALVACGANAARVAEPTAWTATLGPFQFVDRSQNLGHATWAEYVTESEPYLKHLVALTRPLPGATASAMYGFNVTSGGKNVGWVVDGDAVGGYRVRIDLDQDGDLENDREIAMMKRGDVWSADVVAQPVATGRPAPVMRMLFDGENVRAQDDLVRDGVVALSDRLMKVVVQCPRGDCSDRRWVVVGFDLDDDDAIDLADGSFERHLGSDRTVVTPGGTFDLAVALDGVVTLRRSARDESPRPKLRMGTPAPGFAIDVGGARRELDELRGRVVVIDFFSIGCRYCVEDLPWLASVHARYHARGLDVVTIATEGSAEKLVAADHPWWTVIEPGETGPIAALYRVGAYPAYFVIDRDGTIACARCKHADVDAALEKLMP